MMKALFENQKKNLYFKIRTKKMSFEYKHENGIIWKFDKQNKTTSCVFSNDDFSERFYNFSRIFLTQHLKLRILHVQY